MGKRPRFRREIVDSKTEKVVVVVVVVSFHEEGACGGTISYFVVHEGKHNSNSNSISEGERKNLVGIRIDAVY